MFFFASSFFLQCKWFSILWNFGLSDICHSLLFTSLSQLSCFHLSLSLFISLIAQPLPGQRVPSGQPLTTTLTAGLPLLKSLKAKARSGPPWCTNGEPSTLKSTTATITYPVHHPTTAAYRPHNNSYSSSSSSSSSRLRASTPCTRLPGATNSPHKRGRCPAAMAATGGSCCLLEGAPEGRGPAVDRARGRAAATCWPREEATAMATAVVVRLLSRVEAWPTPLRQAALRLAMASAEEEEEEEGTTSQEAPLRKTRAETNSVALLLGLILRATTRGRKHLGGE